MTSDEILINLQAGIIRPNKRKIISCYFLQFKEEATDHIVNWIKSINVTTANKQDNPLITNFYLSKNGYLEIYDKFPSVSPQTIEAMEGIKLESIVNTFSRRFKTGSSNSVEEFLGTIEEFNGISHFSDGMKSVSTWHYGDPPNELEPSYEKDIHALLVLSSDSEQLIEREWARINNSSVCKVLCIENGKRRPGGIGHFGYKDGITRIPFYKKNGELDEEQLSNYITSEYGSFLVYRKLQQNRVQFEDGVKKISKVLINAGTDHDENKMEEFVEGQIMGRFKDGTPIYFCKSSDEKKDHKEKIKQFDNSYFINDEFKTRDKKVGKEDKQGVGYSQDEKGLKCPFHSHIRKMNPRDERVTFASVPRNITRRSVSYDYGPNQKGLLFFCFQKSINKQFSFLQQGWANDSNVYRQGTEPYNKGIDLIAGQPKIPEKGQPRVLTDTNRKWVVNWNQDNINEENSFSLSKFVQFLGGEFFYAPPKNWFENPMSQPYFMKTVHSYEATKAILAKLEK